MFTHLVDQLKAERHRAVPERNVPWPYVTSALTQIGDVPLLPPRALVKMQLRQRAGHLKRKLVAQLTR